MFGRIDAGARGLARPRAAGCSTSARTARRATRRSSGHAVGSVAPPGAASRSCFEPPHAATSATTPTPTAPADRGPSSVQDHDLPPSAATGRGRRRPAPRPSVGAGGEPRRGAERGLSAALRGRSSTPDRACRRRAVDGDRDLVAVPRPPLVDVAVARRVALASDRMRGPPGLRVRRDVRVEPVPRVDVVLAAASYSRSNELAALVVLDRVHEARVVVTELPPAHGAGVVEVFVHVRLAVVVQVADAADLVARALVVDAGDVRLAVAVGVERVDAVAGLGAVLVLQGLGAGRLRRFCRSRLGAAAASRRPEGDDDGHREPDSLHQGNVQARLVHRLQPQRKPRADNTRARPAPARWAQELRISAPRPRREPRVEPRETRPRPSSRLKGDICSRSVTHIRSSAGPLALVRVPSVG